MMDSRFRGNDGRIVWRWSARDYFKSLEERMAKWNWNLEI